MNATVNVYNVVPNHRLKFWDLVEILDDTTRRKALGTGQRMASCYRRVVVRLYPSNERIEWRDGKRLKGKTT